MKTLKVTLDGTVYDALPGETVLQLARRVGLSDRIPSLCYEPSLPPYTSCFVCVVEVEGMGKLVPACGFPVTDGMVVHTSNARVEASRRTAMELLMSNHPADCTAPCGRDKGCPAGVEVQTYLAFAREGRYEDAVRTIRLRNPFPVVCGRVCVRRCEDVCRRQLLDEPVGINMVKRHLSDWWLKSPYFEVPAACTGKKVAVVGGGPAGLTAAYYVRLMGHEVTVFEMREKLGGMVRWGIPDYRLPQDILDQEIGEVLKLGVKVHTGVKVGKDVTVEQLRKDHDAVFLGIGAQLGTLARIEGENHPGVLSGLDFLIGVKRHQSFDFTGKKVAVVGGGNTAIDAARTAVRLKAAEVALLYRRTRNEMPAHPEEVAAAEEEGVKVQLLIAPVAVKLDGERLVGLTCQQMQLGEPDRSGRRRPVPVPGSEHVVPCDVVLEAIGQAVALDGIAGNTGVAATKQGTVEADPHTCATSVKGVFAGGDAATGPAVVIDAIAWGRRAALSIHQYLTVGEAACVHDRFSARKEAFFKVQADDIQEHAPQRRGHQGQEESATRITHFGEVERTVGKAEMESEAERCLRCGCAVREDCRLRELADRYHVPAGISGQAIKHTADTSHPEIVLDPNKCILCTLCSRTCGDILGVSALGLVNRGFETAIAPTMGKPLVESECISCGNCVDACPTGALSFKSLALSGAPREESRSVCMLCGQMCPVVVARNGFGWSIRSATDKAGSRVPICALGRFGNLALLAGERVTTPMMRRRRKLQPVSWEEAFDAVVRGLRRAAKKHGPAGLLFSGAADLSLEEAAALYALAGGFGGRATSLSALLHGTEVESLDALLGDARGTAGWDEVERAGLVVVAGDDPTQHNPVAAAHLRRAVRNGARVLTITSAATRLARDATVRLTVKPGSHSFVLAALLERVIAADPGLAWNPELAGLRPAAGDVDPAQLEERCAVTLSAVEAAYALLSLTRGPIVGIVSLDAAETRSGNDALLVAALVRLLRREDRGSGVLALRRLPNWLGLRYGGLLGTTASQHELALSVAAGEFKAAWITREDPDADSGLRQALAGLDFLVVQDLVLTPTAQRADVFLPASFHLESGGTFIASDGTIHRAPMSAPYLSMHSTWDTLRLVGARLGLPVEAFAFPACCGSVVCGDSDRLARLEPTAWAALPPANLAAAEAPTCIQSAARLAGRVARRG